MEIEVYCDESRPDLFTTEKKTRDRYMVIGSVWLNRDYRTTLKNKIKEIKVKYDLPHCEIKWKYVCPSHLDFYKEIINVFLNEEEKIRFRCIVVDSKKIDLKTYHQNDPELGFYKFYYELLYHWIEKNNKYYIFTDIKTNRKKNRLQKLHEVLNNANNPYATIVSVQALPSKESSLIQMADLLIGAVGYSCHSYNKSSAKSEIVQLIANGIKRQPCEATPRGENKFNVFRIQLNEGYIK